MLRRAAFVMAALAIGGCSHDQRPAPPTWSLRSAATAHLRALGLIGRRNDNTRAAGTPGYDASVDYVADRLRSAGYQVRLQDVPFPVFRDRTPPRLEAAGRRLPVLTLRYSGPGRASAPVALVGLACTPGELRRARGRIAVAARGRCPFRVKARLAQAAGALGLVVADPRSRLPVRGSLGRPGLRHPGGGGRLRRAAAARARAARGRHRGGDGAHAQRDRRAAGPRAARWRWPARTSTRCSRGRASTTTAAASR